MEFKVKKFRKTRKWPSTTPLARLHPFTIERGDIYKLILGFQRCQVVRVRLIVLEHDFALAMGTSALDRTIGAIDRTCACICSYGGHKCVRAHMLQNWPNLFKYKFVYICVIFPMTPISLQSEFYSSRYGHFGGTRRVRIIARLKFASNAPRTVLSSKIIGISLRCTLATCKILKHQN